MLAPDFASCLFSLITVNFTLKLSCLTVPTGLKHQQKKTWLQVWNKSSPEKSKHVFLRGLSEIAMRAKEGDGIAHANWMVNEPHD